MLLVLETLTPTERAVFVLREVFDLAYDEIAGAVGKSPAAARQIAHRARAHVAARRPRGAVSPAQTRDALEAFQRAAETGDLQSLLDILAPDVVFLGDGGGVVQAALAPVVEAGQVARVLGRIDEQETALRRWASRRTSTKSPRSTPLVSTPKPLPPARSQVQDQVAGRLGAADQDAAFGGLVYRVGGVADRSRHQVGLAGVADAGAA